MHKCRLCGQESPPQAHYCMFCGASLQVVTGSEEIRRVTVLFADLAHSTAIISGIAPEQARTLLDSVVHRMRTAVGQFGGIVSRVAGDGIMALFGAPLAVEDHPRRAALAALHMQAQMEAQPLLGPRGERLAICVGVNTGDVLIRSVASDLHVEYTAEGFTTHQAAKLQQAARPGVVLVSAEVARLVDGFVELRPHPPIGLQDFGVFELVRATGTRSRFQAAVGRGLSPFVGREHELARLQAWADAAEGGRVQMVGVVGEAGVGKSRLLWEFSQRQRDRGWRVCGATATLGGVAVAFHPVLGLLLGLYGIDPRDADDVVRARLRDGTDEQGLDITPLLVLLGRAGQDDGWDLLDASDRQARTQVALMAAVEAACRDQPTIAWIEDVHDADAESLAWIEHLLEQPIQGRLLLLLEHRAGEAFALGRAPALATFSVPPLAEADARSLFRHVAGLAGPPIAALEIAMMERVAGNPFFMEEGVRMLSETAVDSLARGLPIPGSVMDVVESRIVLLPTDERDLLQQAAVVGRDVQATLLQGLLGRSLPELAGCLGRLADAGFLVRTDDGRGTRWSFRHAVTQEVAYRMLTRPARRQVHAAIVPLLESQPHALTLERTALMARHAVLAEMWAPALRHLARAALQAGERMSPREALRLLDEALTIVPRLDEPQRMVDQEIDLRLAMRAPLLALGNLFRIGDELRQLEVLASRSKDAVRRCRVAVLVAAHRWLSGQHAKAVEAGRIAISIATQLQDFGLLVPARHYVAAALHELGSLPEALELLNANIDSVPEDAPGRHFGMAGLPSVFALAARSWIHAHRGDFAASRRDVDEALRIARMSGHDFSRLAGIFASGVLALHREEHAEASLLLAEGVALSEREAQRMWQPSIAALRALNLAKTGEVTAARALLDKAIPKRHNPVIPTFTLLTVAQCDLATGCIGDARRMAEAALTRARHHGELIWEAEALALVGDIAVTEGLDLGLAVSNFSLAFDRAKLLGLIPLADRCLRRLAVLGRNGKGALWPAA